MKAGEAEKPRGDWGGSNLKNQFFLAALRLIFVASSLSCASEKTAMLRRLQSQQLSQERY